MEFDIQLIQENFDSISPKLDELTMTFYTDLFSEHPEMKAMFGGVDLMRQRRKLAAMLTLIVTNLERMDVLVSALRALGGRHIAYGATAENYAWTQATLLRSLEKVTGEAWTEELAVAWENAIGLVTSEMLAGAAEEEERVEAESRPNEDIDLLMEIASNPALSFQKNSLFSTYIAKKKTDHEMSLARTVQRTLIPSGFPEVEAYRFAATYEPATQVGGDYYDWIMPDEHRICFIFGDVSGKGLSGALIMCRLAGAARALLGNEHDPARALGAINAHLCDRMPGGRFVTLALLALDLKTHQFTLANAGHLPPLYRGPDGAAAYVGHEAAGIPIGIEKDASYEEYAGVFEPDSALVFYTDGVSEAMGTGTTLYGMDRLRACVAAVDEPIDVGRALRDDVRRFGRGRPQSDDLTILTVARDGPGRQRGGVSPAHASSRAE